MHRNENGCLDTPVFPPPHRPSEYGLNRCHSTVSFQDMIISGLQPETSYSLTVTAYTTKGDGARSKPKLVSTTGAGNQSVHLCTLNIFWATVILIFQMGWVASNWGKNKLWSTFFVFVSILAEKKREHNLLKCFSQSFSKCFLEHLLCARHYSHDWHTSVSETDSALPKFTF